MREIHVREIEETVRRLFLEANFSLGPGVLEALKAALEEEISPLGREVLREIIENARIASEERIPLCQDTGLAVVFLEIGQEVRLTGGDLRGAVNRGVRRAYAEGHLRKSVCHPLSRENTRDNTPAVIHLDLVPGDRVRIVALPKGGGSENTSRVTVLPPSAGREGIMGYVIDCVREAGPNPCPPILVGIGVGSSLEGAAIMAK
ncbi:MAG: fumarate hydratase, partial [Deltaproteobacteria bacterium]